MGSPFEQLKECMTCGLEKPSDEFPRRDRNTRSIHCTACTNKRTYQKHLQKRLKAKIKDALRPETLSDVQRIEAERAAKAEQANADAFARLRGARDAIRDG